MTEQAEFTYTFRLKSGSHHDRASGQNIEAGGLFRTNEDMIKTDGANRWELIEEGKESVEELRARLKQLEARLPAQPPQEPDELDHKSIKELRQMASEMSPPVDLTTCTGKPEIISAIRQALDAA